MKDIIVIEGLHISLCESGGERERETECVCVCQRENRVKSFIPGTEKRKLGKCEER